MPKICWGSTRAGSIAQELRSVLSVLFPNTLTSSMDVSVRKGTFPEVSEDDEMHPLLGMERGAYLSIFCSALRTGCNYDAVISSAKRHKQTKF